MTYLTDKQRSPRWALEVNGFNYPTQNSHVILIEPATLSNSRSVVKKYSTNNILVLYLFIGIMKIFLVIQNLSLILLGYSGFLLYDDLSFLICKDIKLFENNLEINISHSITDQY